MMTVKLDMVTRLTEQNARLLPLIFISRIFKPLQKGYVLLTSRRRCTITHTKRTTFWFKKHYSELSCSQLKVSEYY